MRLIVTGAAALGFVFASAAVPALAQKSGGTLRVLHRDTPASASIHEEATISVNMPYMSVFNNLVFFDPKEKINSPDKIVPELATALGKPSADAARKAAQRALVRLAEEMSRGESEPNRR